MAYKALYRTYRPDDFEQMAGQKHIVKTLENAIIQNKIAHAYLFCGPRGTGKTSSAKIFAKAINCESNEKKPCGVCPNCLATANNTHPDIIEIDAASNNGVEEARNLIEKVKYAPSLGKYKIYIIDEVHMMSTGAFNALLKTIEEPPAHVIFILATTEPHKVLPTIISRCQRFDFTKISKHEIIKRLNCVVEEEKIEIEDKAIENIAILSDGGMRDALSILDQCRAYSPNHISLQDVNDIYGVVNVQEICGLIAHIKIKDMFYVMNAVEKFDSSGADIKRLTTDLINILKESVIYDYGKSEEMLSLLSVNQVIEIKENLSPKQRLSMIDVLMNAFEKYQQASSVVSYFEIAMLKLMDLIDNKVADSKIEVNEIQANKVEKNEYKETIAPMIEIESKDIVKDEIKENVSHETLEEKNTKLEVVETIQKDSVKETVEVKQKELDLEFVLRLLVGANKPEKMQDNEKMKEINTYLLDFTVAKYAHLIKNATIIASSETYIVLCVESMIKANEINDLDKNSEFIGFTKKLLEKAKKVFALTAEQRTIVIEMFKERQKMGTLPKPYEFKLEKEKDEEVDEQMKNLKMLFDEIEIRED